MPDPGPGDTDPQTEPDVLDEPFIFWSFRPDFGPYLRDLREGLRLSLREVGERSGVSHAVLARLETGQKAKKPPLDVLRRLADAYGRDQDELLERGGFLFWIPSSQATSDTQDAAVIEAEFAALMLDPELRPSSFGKENLNYIAPLLKRQFIQVARKLVAMKDPAEVLERLLAEGRALARARAHPQGGPQGGG